MAKTIAEINEKIKAGRAVVCNAEEIIEIAGKKGVAQTAREVDVVTTGTFGIMCSSGIYFNTGHTRPRIKFGGGRVYLNDVPAYTGLAAVDLFLGANALPDDDPRNRVHPGEFNYGGGHVIEELVAGKDIRLSATAYGTDCYPRKRLDTLINIKDLNQATLFNIRNAYQNYNVAVNLSDKTIYTYMGVLKPRPGQRQLLVGGAAFAPLQRPLLPHHRHRHADIPGRGHRLRRLARHPAQPGRAPHGKRRAAGGRRHPGRHRRPQADEPEMAGGHERPRLRVQPHGGHRRAHTRPRRRNAANILRLPTPISWRPSSTTRTPSLISSRTSWPRSRTPS